MSDRPLVFDTIEKYRLREDDLLNHLRTLFKNDNRITVEVKNLPHLRSP